MSDLGSEPTSTGWAAPRPFDVCGPLPSPGITVLEASAGTGKTFALTALITRFVAEGVPLSAILAVTFTRMATGELRDRTRRRLVTAEDRLGRHLRTGEPVPDDDRVVAVLATGSRPEVEARHVRLASAIADFDAATIATTHGFCQLVLEGLGSAGDVASGTSLLEDPTDLVAEVVDDLFLRRALRYGLPPFMRAAAGKVAARAVANPDIRLVPPGGDDPDGLLARLAARARDEVARRLQEDNLLTYDQLLWRLAQTLEDGKRGELACRRLRRRYQVVLVDEFQDTDPIQWRAVRSAFGGGDTTLVLVGDPKQAVYAFRGADVHAYLDAAGQLGTRLHTLGDNWRSGQPLIDALDAVLSPLQFGDPSIRYRAVRAPADRQGASTRRLPGAAPLRFRVVDSRQPGIQRTPTGTLLQKGALVEWIAGDVAADVAGLLASGAEIAAGASPAPGGGPATATMAAGIVVAPARAGGPAPSDRPTWRAVRPADVAVLTRTNKQSVSVRDALRAAEVPAVVAGLETVFASDAAGHWSCLLEALQEPASRPRAVAVALTPFVGLSPAEVATAGDDRWEAVYERVHRWASVLAVDGVAALYRTITAEEGLPARLLATVGGERELTDLGHVAELALHAEATDGQLGASSLRAWLAQRITRVDEQVDAEERSRRLDSDAEAVQVLTVHRAKGLEFGIVYCPFLWDPPPSRRSPDPVVFHDPDAEGARTLDVGCVDGTAPARQRYNRHLGLEKAEDRGEELRLLYVAVTRARHHVVVWWSQARDSRHSALARLLLDRDATTGAVADPAAGEPKDRVVRAALERIAGRAAPGLIALEAAGQPPVAGRSPVAAAGPAGGIGAGPGPASQESPGGGAGGGVGGAGPAVPAGSPSGRGLAPAAASDLRAAQFQRHLDLRWRRASYTSVTAAAHGDPAGADLVGSEPEDPGVADEPPGPAGGPAPGGPAPGAPAPGPAEEPGLDVASPLGGVPGGTEVGTFVHRILERVDFAVPDLEGEVLAAADRLRGAGPSPVAGGTATLAAGLTAALSTPLGPLLPEMRLRDLARSDRLDELDFELPVAGGDGPVGAVATADIVALLADHLPAGGPLAGYERRLADPLLATELRGYLTGSLDLVFRRAGSGGGVSRWYVADYKTNWLGQADQPLTAWHYRPEALDAEMQRRHYPLQALFYVVALHRYLRWRLAGYDPEVHLGGVLYLFLRGMVGPATPDVGGERCGVFSWSPPAELVVGLSDLLAVGGSER